MSIVDSTLSASYTYFDFESDPDSASSFQWYNAIDTTLSTGDAIPDANDSLYKIILADTVRFIRVGVTPVSSSGNSPGTELRSRWFGPVPLVP